MVVGSMIKYQVKSAKAQSCVNSFVPRERNEVRQDQSRLQTTANAAPASNATARGFKTSSFFKNINWNDERVKRNLLRKIYK